MRTPKSFTIDEEIEDYLVRTRGGRSASDRVNELLRRAILLEQQEQLEKEAAAFFANARDTDRTETHAFQKASLATLNRD